VTYNKQEMRLRYKDLFKNSLDFIYVHDLKGNFLDANEVALNKLGYEAEEMKSLNFKDILVDKSQLKKALEFAKEIVYRGRQSTRSRYKIRNKKGDTFYIETYGIPLKNQGEVYAILGIGTDITQRKITQHKLQESEKRYRNLFETSPYGIGLINSQGRIIDCNPTLEQLTGFKREEIVNKHFKKVPIIQKRDIPLLLSLFKKMIKGTHVHRIDIQLRKKDGGLIWTNLQGSIIKFEKEPYLQVIVHDISKRKEVELLISQELTKLKQLDKTRKNLIMRISHELKTPIMLINGGIEYINEQGELKLNEDSEEILKSIERASTRLRKLTENLIDSTRIDYDKLILKKNPADIVRIIEEVIQDLDYLIKERDLTLIKKLPETTPLMIDQLRMHQVLTNLVLNAIKNTPPNGKLILTLRKEEDRIEFIIEDTGIGFTDKEKEQLFTRFGKIERNDEDFDFIDIQGSGLGLFISKAIVELHGGKIWAESEGRKKGSKFIFQLPKNEIRD
jgi:PAS domain S-box-containing protein